MTRVHRVRFTYLPLAPLAPAAVCVLGIAIAFVVAIAGVAHLRSASDGGAAEKADVLAAALAARARVTSPEDRAAVFVRAWEETGIDTMLVEQSGDIIFDPSAAALSPSRVASLLTAGGGIVELPHRRMAFAARQLPQPYANLAVIVLAPAPSAPAGTRALLAAIAMLATALTAMAAAASYAFAKAAQDDMAFVRERIEHMAEERATRVTALVPVRTFDQVGVLTSEFNMLVERFAAAERAYQQDLEAAEALERSRAQFLAALSHELRTPLNAVLGFADLLLAEVEGPLTASAREDLDVIRKSGEHLRALIDDILDLSAIETGNLRLDRSVIDVSEVADEVVREARTLVAGKPVELRVEAPAGALAFADRRRVWQILANLVGNAAKFTARGRVDVRVESRGSTIVVDVSDTGPGIAEGARAAIFEEFEQDGDTVSRRKGTGLGLAIARRLTVMHAGRLTLTSEVGVGSTFRVEIPAQPDTRNASRFAVDEGEATVSIPPQPPPSRRELPPPARVSRRPAPPSPSRRGGRPS